MASNDIIAKWRAEFEAAGFDFEAHAIDFSYIEDDVVEVMGRALRAKRQEGSMSGDREELAEEITKVVLQYLPRSQSGLTMDTSEAQNIKDGLTLAFNKWDFGKGQQP